MKEKLKSRDSTDISVVLDEIVSLNNQKNGLEILIASKKNVIRSYFEKNGVDQVKNDDVTAYISTRTNIVYDIKSIKKKVSKDKYKEFIKKTYTLDSKKFKDECLKNNIDYNKFANDLVKCGAIVIEESVDENKLNVMYDNNEITLNDLEGCYEANTKKSISLRFRRNDSSFKVNE